MLGVGAKFVTTRKERRRKSRRFSSDGQGVRLQLHPLFWLVGVWYCFTGELFLFLTSCVVAVQHECAHAFAAAKLGYKLHRIVLMPFGAVIDGDMHDVSFKDEAFVALCGPLCNLVTALFFGALWWFAPDLYAYTDTAFYSSLAIALVNLLPAYPLDGGRIVCCALARGFASVYAEQNKAEAKAKKICRVLTLAFSALFFAAFFLSLLQHAPNASLLAFGGFLLVGAFGNQEGDAVYGKMDFSSKDALKKGVELRRVAVLDSRPIKDALRYLARGSYLVLEVYDENERHLFDLPQNEFSAWFLQAKSPYASLRELRESQKRTILREKSCKTAQNL